MTALILSRVFLYNYHFTVISFFEVNVILKSKTFSDTFQKVDFLAFQAIYIIPLTEIHSYTILELLLCFTEDSVQKKSGNLLNAPRNLNRMLLYSKKGYES